MFNIFVGWVYYVEMNVFADMLTCSTANVLSNPCREHSEYYSTSSIKQMKHLESVFSDRFFNIYSIFFSHFSVDKSTSLCNSMRAFKSSYSVSLRVGQAERLYLTSNRGADIDNSRKSKRSYLHFERKSASPCLLYIIIQCTVHN